MLAFTPGNNTLSLTEFAGAFGLTLIASGFILLFLWQFVKWLDRFFLAEPMKEPILNELILYTGAGYIFVDSPNYLYAELRFPNGRIIRSIADDQISAVRELTTYTKLKGLYQPNRVRRDLGEPWEENPYGNWGGR